jgi:DNA-binding response OmpR family regulator
MRILVVEDEHLIASSIKKGLEQERYSVDIAHDGIEGYDLAQSGDFDLIILDLMLPGKDGLTICWDLRKNGIHTPILILTAKGQVTDKVKGLNTGADDYLVKPFSFEELLARVKALGRRPKNSLSTTLMLGDLQLDSITYEVRREGKLIQLSSKEFQLLEYLIRHPRQVLSKQQLIDHVWNYDADILPNTVEVYIRKLRDKIDKPFKGKKELIRTLRGFGYKLDDK